MSREIKFVKDMGFDRFVREYPKHTIVHQMRTLLPNGYRYYLVDHIILNCVPGVRTCSDVSWHFDGDYNKDNKYCLYVEGPNRTQFSTKQITTTPPEGRFQQNTWLNKELEGYPAYSINEKEIVSYTSQTPHRGVICSEYGIRDFTRVMCSNYIVPKTISKRK